MKYRLKQEACGRAAGTIVTMHTDGVRTAYVQDPSGDTIHTMKENLELIVEDSPPEPSALTRPAPEPALVPRLVVDEATEAEARAFYDDYCAAVGGVAFNGDPLPPASEFFEDPKKQKQANAYRASIAASYDRFVKAAAEGEDLAECELLDLSKRWSRAKFEVTGVKQVEGGEDITMIAVAANHYGSDGMDENNTYAYYSPMADLSLSVRNPNLVGEVFPGTRLYADFFEAPDSAPRKPAPAEEKPRVESVDEIKKSEEAGQDDPSVQKTPAGGENGTLLKQNEAAEANGSASAPLDVVDDKATDTSKLDESSGNAQDADAKTESSESPDKGGD